MADLGLRLESRIMSVLSVYAFAVLGVFLLVAPWTPVWEQAILALVPPGLEGLLRSGWIRGAVSGLGAVDLVVAAQLGLQLWQRARS